MASELRRGIVRLVANYGRMIANILLGLWMVRLLLQGLQNEGFGLVGLLGSTVGITRLVQQTVSQSLIREMGAAYHNKDPHVFRGTYHSALLLSALATVAVGIVFAAAILVVLPWLKMSDLMRPSARWFVIAMAAQSLFGVMLAPIRNMYLIKEQMVAVNVLGILHTARRTASALVVAMSVHEPTHALIMYGVLSSGLSVLVQLTAAAIAVNRDRRLIPSLSCASSAGMRSILRLGGRNMIMLVAMDLHVHVGAFIMNLAFDASFGSAIWHLATRLTSYVRRVADAALRGTDAVAVRVDSEGGADAVRQLLYHTTRFNSFAVLPCVVAIIGLAKPCLELWVGDRVEQAEKTIPAATMLVQILVIGMACRGLSNGWFRIFYGAGHVRRYAPSVLLGAVVNPLLAVGLLKLFDVQYTCAAWGNLVGFALFNAGFATRAGAKATGVTYAQLITPMGRPLLASLLSCPILVVSILLINHWQIWSLLAIGLSYFLVHCALSWRIVLDRTERQRFSHAIRRRLGGPHSPRRAPHEHGKADVVD